LDLFANYMTIFTPDWAESTKRIYHTVDCFSWKLKGREIFTGSRGEGSLEIQKYFFI
jgi:hypothetical protein